jgi:F-type H+-transporting ATPase subunit delta
MSFALPYARAFLEAAPKGYDVEAFLSSGGSLARAIETDRTLRAFLASPGIPDEAKRKALTELAARSGIDAFGARFLELLLRHRRILSTAVILAGIRDSYDAERGVLEGRVTVASPIGDAEKATIEEALGAKLQSRVRVKVAVDPKILGGFVARVGSSVFDASAAAGIRRFQEQAKGRTGA